MSAVDDQSLHTVKGYMMLSKGTLTQSLEDYLEMIHRLCAGTGYTRISDLAKHLNVGASSASKMVQKLGELGFVHYERYGMVRLTHAGERSGAYLVRRHNVVSRFFALLGAVSDQLRETELVEHCVTPQTVARLQALNHVLERNRGFRDQIDKAAKELDSPLP